MPIGLSGVCGRGAGELACETMHRSRRPGRNRSSAGSSYCNHRSNATCGTAVCSTFACSTCDRSSCCNRSCCRNHSWEQRRRSGRRKSGPRNHSSAGSSCCSSGCGDGSAACSTNCSSSVGNRSCCRNRRYRNHSRHHIRRRQYCPTWQPGARMRRLGTTYRPDRPPSRRPTHGSSWGDS
jgi:hypothetical protein